MGWSCFAFGAILLLAVSNLPVDGKVIVGKKTKYIVSSKQHAVPKTKHIAFLKRPSVVCHCSYRSYLRLKSKNLLRRTDVIKLDPKNKVENKFRRDLIYAPMCCKIDLSNRNRLYRYPMTIRLTEKVYSDLYANDESAEYQELSAELVNATNDLFGADSPLVSVEVSNFTSGSIIADLILTTKGILSQDMYETLKFAIESGHLGTLAVSLVQEPSTTATNTPQGGPTSEAGNIGAEPSDTSPDTSTTGTSPDTSTTGTNTQGGPTNLNPVPPAPGTIPDTSTTGTDTQGGPTDLNPVPPTSEAEKPGEEPSSTSPDTSTTGTNTQGGPTDLNPMPPAPGTSPDTSTTGINTQGGPTNLNPVPPSSEAEKAGAEPSSTSPDTSTPGTNTQGGPTDLNPVAPASEAEKIGPEPSGTSPTIPTTGTNTPGGLTKPTTGGGLTPGVGTSPGESNNINPPTSTTGTNPEPSGTSPQTPTTGTTTPGGPGTNTIPAAGVTPANGVGNTPEETTNNIPESSTTDTNTPQGTGITPATIGTSSPAGADAAFHKECLCAHNQKRRVHGTPDMTWSAQIAATAQEWANNLASLDNPSLIHDDSQYGENLYMELGDIKPTKEGACRIAVDSWYKEIEVYKFDNPGFSAATGHFTQVIWRKSTKLGVAEALSATNKRYVVARYEARGNVMGEFAENVPRSKTGSPAPPSTVCSNQAGTGAPAPTPNPPIPGVTTNPLTEPTPSNPLAPAVTPNTPIPGVTTNPVTQVTPSNPLAPAVTPNPPIPGGTTNPNTQAAPSNPLIPAPTTKPPTQGVTTNPLTQATPSNPLTPGVTPNSLTPGSSVLPTLSSKPPTPGGGAVETGPGGTPSPPGAKPSEPIDTRPKIPYDPTKRAKLFDVVVDLVDQIFSSALSNPASAQFQELKNKLEQAIMAVYEEIAAFRSVTVTGFRPAGSKVHRKVTRILRSSIKAGVDAEIELAFTDDMPNQLSPLEKEVKAGHLKNFKVLPKMTAAIVTPNDAGTICPPSCMPTNICQPQCPTQCCSPQNMNTCQPACPNACAPGCTMTCCNLGNPAHLVKKSAKK